MEKPTMEALKILCWCSPFLGNSIMRLEETANLKLARRKTVTDSLNATKAVVEEGIVTVTVYCKLRRWPFRIFWRWCCTSICIKGSGQTADCKLWSEYRFTNHLECFEDTSVHDCFQCNANFWSKITLILDMMQRKAYVWTWRRSYH